MQRREFGREFKLEAMRLLKDRGVAVAQAAREFCVPAGSTLDSPRLPVGAMPSYRHGTPIDPRYAT